MNPALSDAPVYDLRDTLFFPLTGNPAGFHHLLVTEIALRQFPEIARVVFILSNGNHPDPTKRQQIPEKHLRLALLQRLLADVRATPPVFPVAHATSLTDPLRLPTVELQISTLEFQQELTYRLADHVRYIWQQSSLESRSPNAVKVLIGADLAERMLLPHIFGETDLLDLAEPSHLLVVPRPESDATEALAMLPEQRGVTLKHSILHPELLPVELRPFLFLSSTLIRRAVQAQHRLDRFLSANAIQLMRERELFCSRDLQVAMNEWEQHCWQLEQELEATARAFLRLLRRRAAQGLAARFGVVETTTGGRLSAVWVSLTGASEFFVGGLVAYGKHEKERLLGRKLRDDEANVSEEMARSLAEIAQLQMQADWVLSETGMAGPISGERHSHKNGLCHLALATSSALSWEPATQHQIVRGNPFFSKKGHQLYFALQSLRWMHEVVNRHTPEVA
jgi:PncC family amidohydrolase